MSEKMRAATKATLAANVRRLRIASRVSMSELARATSIGKATLSAIENGRGNATIDTVVAIAAALRVTPAELLTAPEGEPTVVTRARTGEPTAGPLGPGWFLDGADVEGAVELWDLRLGPAERRELLPLPAGRRALVVTGGRVLAGPAQQPVELDTGDHLSCAASSSFAIEVVSDGADVVVVLLGAR
jgi:transcriptional regulator with XRE-family HTH domain